MRKSSTDCYQPSLDIEVPMACLPCPLQTFKNQDLLCDLEHYFCAFKQFLQPLTAYLGDSRPPQEMYLDRAKLDFIVFSHGESRPTTAQHDSQHLELNTAQHTARMRTENQS